MEKFLQQRVFDNTIEAYLYVVCTILVMVFLRRMISRFLAHQLYRFISKKGNSTARQSFLDLVVQPLGLFLLFTISVIAVDKLTFPGVLDIKIYKVTTRQIIESVANGVWVYLFIRLCLCIIDFIALILKEKTNLSKDPSENQLVIFFKDFFKVILIIIGILLVMRFSFNRNLGSLLTGLSIVGAAIALATRESMENLIASFIIFFDKPFAVGDLVKVNNFTGNIEKIGLRSTRIRTTDKTYISVPNKQMVDTIVDNISLRTQRKVELRMEIGLSATAAQLKEAVEAFKKIVQRPNVDSSVIFLSETGKTAHVITIDYFTPVKQEVAAFNQLREDINLELITWLTNNGLDLAAASTDIVVKQAVTEEAQPQA